MTWRILRSMYKQEMKLTFMMRIEKPMAIPIKFHKVCTSISMIYFYGRIAMSRKHIRIFCVLRIQNVYVRHQRCGHTYIYKLFVVMCSIVR